VSDRKGKKDKPAWNNSSSKDNTGVRMDVGHGVGRCNGNAIDFIWQARISIKNIGYSHGGFSLLSSFP
jgi:hypothetical protein